MVLYYLKTAYRNLQKSKTNSIINVVGFGIALSVVILIGMYANKELTTNQFHKGADRIFKVSGWATPTALAPFLKERIPEIESVTRIGGSWNNMLSLVDKPENQVPCQILLTENSFFNVFTYPIIKGNPKTVLTEPNTIVLSEKITEKLFGSENALGKNILLNGTQLTIVGIIETPPHNSSLLFDGVISTVESSTQNDLSNKKMWDDWRFETFAKFHNKIKNKEALTKKIQEAVSKNGHLLYEVEHLKLYTLKEVYFNNSLYSRFLRGDEKNVFSMVWIGILILILAIVNFFNLSTSQAMARCKEVGIRKVNGSKRITLIYQFFFETFIVSFLSMLLAMLIINLVLPSFNSFIKAEFDLFHFKDLQSWILLLLGSFILSILAGSYPALYMSSFNPITAIKKGEIKSKGAITFKQIIIVFQFIVSIFLITATLFISKQLDFLKTKDLGFEKESVICLYPTASIFKHFKAFTSKLTSNPGILGISKTRGTIGNWDHGFKLKTRYYGEEKEIWCKQTFVDTAFTNVFDIELIEHRSIDKTKPYILLNEAAIKNLQAKSPLGLEIKSQHREEYTPIAGVVKDFHFKSLRHGVEPLTIYVNPQMYGLINVRFNPKSYKSISDLIDFCKSAAKEFAPNESLSYKFLDDILAESYKKEKKFRFLISLFSGLAIFISCLGLFGMITFSNARRRKEIGVRKVSGASTLSIIKLLVQNYAKWVLIAFVISAPLSYYFIEKWLNNYPFRTSMDLWVFALAGLFTLVIALLTVSWQTYIAATKNPVDALRDE